MFMSNRRRNGYFRIVLHVQYDTVFTLVEFLKVRADFLNVRHRNQLQIYQTYALTAHKIQHKLLQLVNRDATAAERLRSTKVWVPTNAPRWVLGAREGRPLPLCGFGGITPGKFFENSYAKSCILVTICCEISCFLKKLEGPIHCWSRT